ncbi:hypothetical protein Bbelb_334580 [Branchiostoma belcheri]|nr:hypothetical protein Bbelb_334580 [Branchiostoma belcheri]
MLILDTLDDLHNLLLRTAIVVNDLHAAVDNFAGERQGNHNATDLAGGPHPHHNPGGVVWEHPYHNPAEPMGEYEQQVGYPQYEDDGPVVDDNQSEGSVILHLLETYGVFTDASPTPEMVCLTDAVVITATRHLRVTYSIQHRYEGPSRIFVSNDALASVPRFQKALN